MVLRGLWRLRAAGRFALRGLRAAPLVFLASSGTLTAGLLLLSVYLLTLSNMRAVLERVGQDFKLVVFLPPGAGSTDGEREELLRDIRSLDGVASVAYVSAEEALERLREALGSEGSLVDGLQRNPLPASFEVWPEAEHRPAARIRTLASRLAELHGVDEVRYGVEWVEGYTRILHALEWVGLLLGGFLLLVLGAIIAGTARLALHSRHDELRIQRLVGAGTLFVRLPFYIEGVLQGVAAAGVALGLLLLLYELGLPLLGEPLRFLVGGAELRFLRGVEILFLFLVGVGLGAGGTAAALLHMDDEA
jgi:cell division transport system permease protein